MGGGGAAAGWIDGWMPRSRVAGRNAGGGFFLPWVGVRVWVLGGGGGVLGGSGGGLCGGSASASGVCS